MATGTAVDVVMPQMGVSVSEGTVTKWLKSEGDPVVADEPLLEISTDKVDTEVPSPGEGILAEIIVPEGQTVEVGTVLARIAPAGSEPPRLRAPRPPPRPRRPSRRQSPSPPPRPRPAATAARTERASSRRSSPGSPPSTGSTFRRSRAPVAAGA